MNQDNRNQAMIELRSPMMVYRPVLKAGISIVSDDLDEMGLFSRFILWMIGQETSVDMMEEVTLLDRSLILEELVFLKEIGLVEERSPSLLQLTDLGEEVFRKMKAIESFNQSEHQILIDCVTGNLIPFHEELLDEQDVAGGQPILKDKIVRELYQNLDPCNSREFLFSHYEFPELSEEEREALHVEVKAYGRTFYQPVLVFSVPDISHSDALIEPIARIEQIPCEEQNKEIVSGVSVVYPFLPFTLKLVHKELERYRSVLDTLDRLHEFDPDLLGEKALRLLEWRDTERRLSQGIPKLYLDQVSGAIIDRLPEEAVPYADDRRSDLMMKPQYGLDDLEKSKWENLLQQLTGEQIDVEEWELSLSMEPVQHMTIWTVATSILS
jgi:hypothetical protein